MMSKLRSALAELRHLANWYEPVVARTLVAAFFQMLTGVGIVVGDLPDKANAVLVFLALMSTLLAGKSIRGAVVSPATSEGRENIAAVRGYTQGVVTARRETR